MKCKPESERFWAMVDKAGPNGCWLWTGGRRGTYGFFTIDRGDGHTTIGSHKYAYTTTCGPVPDGLQLDHLCRNRICVNPAHLEPVTIAENLRRGHEATGTGPYATHCLRGHEYTEANTYRRVDRPSRGCRACRTMQAAASTQRTIAALGGWSELTTARERIGMTKAELARLSNLPPHIISNLETGRRRPNPQIVHLLVAVIPAVELRSAA